MCAAAQGPSRVSRLPFMCHYDESRHSKNFDSVALIARGFIVGFSVSLSGLGSRVGVAGPGCRFHRLAVRVREQGLCHQRADLPSSDQYIIGFTVSLSGLGSRVGVAETEPDSPSRCPG